MKENEVRAQLETYADEELLALVDRTRTEASELQIDIAIDLLRDRGYNLNEIEGHTNANIAMEDADLEDLPLIHQLSYLAEQDSEFEENRLFEQDYNIAYSGNDDLLAVYLDMVEKINKAGRFSEDRGQYSFDHFLKTYQELHSREIALSWEQKKLEKKARWLLINELERKGRNNLLLGLFLLAIALVLFIATWKPWGKIAITIAGVISIGKAINFYSTANSIAVRTANVKQTDTE